MNVPGNGWHIVSFVVAASAYHVFSPTVSSRWRHHIYVCINEMVCTCAPWLRLIWDRLFHNLIAQLGPSHKSHNTTVPYPSMYHFVAATLIARFMGPTWGPSGADRAQVGPILAPWTLLSENVHASLLQNNALWDIWLMHCGICEMDLFACLQYWAWGLSVGS